MTRTWNDLLTRDHTTIEKVFGAMEKALAGGEAPAADLMLDCLDFFSTYVERCHNRKEADHLFPLIQELGIPAEGGPLGVMLAEHERQSELVGEMKKHGAKYLGGDAASLVPFRAVFQEYAALCKDHYWKENDILYPMAIRVMSPADDAKVLAGIEAVEAAIGPDTHAKYFALAEKLTSQGGLEDLSFGLDRSVLASILNMLPVEISFVDADDVVQYFSHEDQDKIFPRNRSAIGTKVQTCHPAQSVHLVNRILADFKAGTREVAEFWIDFQAKFVHIRYFPVHDQTGAYIGCLEVVQDVKPIRALEGERRLLAEE
jgi:uncharacterized protein